MLNSSKIPAKRGGFWAKKTISAILKKSSVLQIPKLKIQLPNKAVDKKTMILTKNKLSCPFYQVRQTEVDKIG